MAGNKHLSGGAYEPHWNFVGVAFQPVLAQSVANRLVVFFRKVLAQILHGGLVQGQSFHKVLVVYSHAARNNNNNKINDTTLVGTTAAATPRCLAHRMNRCTYRRRLFRLTSPVVGFNSPVSSFSNVDYVLKEGTCGEIKIDMQQATNEPFPLRSGRQCTRDCPCQCQSRSGRK